MDLDADSFIALLLIVAPFVTFALGYWCGYRRRDTLSWKRRNKLT